ncbi:isopeptide-forming domain-containing fimbrial protein, partial [Burkholderia cenocepacia]|uniref:isopeptide-forming domain-containing fimbrial protein n=1 Tax=Burkholderia cenocepacia TaxID=95486 RepID=UPI0038CBF5C8
VSNDAGRSVALDVRVVDRMPADVTPTDATGAPVTQDQQLPNGGFWDQESRTIAWTFSTLQPNQRIDIRIPSVVSDPLTSGSSLRNVANVTSSTTPPGTTGRETGSTVSAGSDVSVNAPQISLTKSVDLAQATIGQSLRYTVDVTIPASTQSYDVTVVDQLPAGIAFDGLVSSSIPVTTLEGANGQVAFVIGDVASAPEERVVRIVYAAHVTDDLASGAVVQN